ncbi:MULTISPECIES: hypothetical protein [unclassified Calothrix]|uniref:hypothetical protein n=1 Tax=unclassified Calothrix TaxID=2619626 RepID=UPI0016831F87|nr:MULTISPECIES: hypothetical protein [unclassified Calothrix]MBD2207847.1 hypothetical protein [Calothrix sp. FACHB-168]
MIPKRYRLVLVIGIKVREMQRSLSALVWDYHLSTSLIDLPLWLANFAYCTRY